MSKSLRTTPFVNQPMEAYFLLNGDLDWSCQKSRYNIFMTTVVEYIELPSCESKIPSLQLRLERVSIIHQLFASLFFFYVDHLQLENKIH